MFKKMQKERKLRVRHIYKILSLGIEFIKQIRLSEVEAKFWR